MQSLDLLFFVVLCQILHQHISVFTNFQSFIQHLKKRFLTRIFLFNGFTQTPPAKILAWVQHLFLHYSTYSDTLTYLFSLNIMSSNLLSACNKDDKLRDHQQLTFEFFSRICLLIYLAQFVRGFQSPPLFQASTP